MKLSGVLKTVTGAVLINSIIPAFYYKNLSPRVIRRLKKTTADKEVMLTFDDGPDERYTGKLLDVLKQNNIHAVFFIVIEQAKRNPDLIKRIIAENHRIGFHSGKHKSELLHSFYYTKEEFESGISFMKKWPCDMIYYRPPWGQANLFSGYFARKYNMPIMLWDVMAEDWKANATVEGICQKIRTRVREGSIICLHDAGENSGGAKDAPLKTIQALSIVIPELKRKGYRFV